MAMNSIDIKIDTSRLRAALEKHANVAAKAAAAVVDPWVVVGRTTIDGTLEQVAARVVGFDSIPKWVNSEGCERVIDEWMRDRAVLKIGGQHLRPCGSHINGSRGTALIRCDVVRRKSEIDAESFAEAMRAVAPTISELAAQMKAMDPCPECGPHGNRGEVLLASSWAKCTTCNGGKAGDLWGEVKAEGPSTAESALSSALIAEGASSEVAQAGVRAFIKTLRGFGDGEFATYDTVGHKPGGFGMPTVAELSNLAEAQREALCRATMMSHEVLFGVPAVAHRIAGETDDAFRQRIRSHFGVVSVADNQHRYLEGDRIVDRWGRTGVVVPFDGSDAYPATAIRARMDEGWFGIFSGSEIVGKAGA